MHSMREYNTEASNLCFEAFKEFILKTPKGFDKIEIDSNVLNRDGHVFSCNRICDYIIEDVIYDTRRKLEIEKDIMFEFDEGWDEPMVTIRKEIQNFLKNHIDNLA